MGLIEMKGDGHRTPRSFHISREPLQWSNLYAGAGWCFGSLSWTGREDDDDAVSSVVLRKENLPNVMDVVLGVICQAPRIDWAAQMVDPLTFA